MAKSTQSRERSERAVQRLLPVVMAAVWLSSATYAGPP